MTKIINMIVVFVCLHHFLCASVVDLMTETSQGIRHSIGDLNIHYIPNAILSDIIEVGQNTLIINKTAPDSVDMRYFVNADLLMSIEFKNERLCSLRLKRNFILGRYLVEERLQPNNSPSMENFISYILPELLVRSEVQSKMINITMLPDNTISLTAPWLGFRN